LNANLEAESGRQFKMVTKTGDKIAGIICQDGVADRGSGITLLIINKIEKKVVGGVGFRRVRCGVKRVMS